MLAGGVQDRHPVVEVECAKVQGQGHGMAKVHLSQQREGFAWSCSLFSSF